jgi:CyaY protein
MTDNEFSAIVEATLRDIEDALDASDVDVESVRNGPVLQIEFDDGSKIVVNAQVPMRELWVAARAGGFHFRLRERQWVDSRGAGELWQALSGWVGQQAGVAVDLAPPSR